MKQPRTCPYCHGHAHTTYATAFFCAMECREMLYAQRDAALALLADIKHEVEIGEDNAWARNLVDRIDTLLGGDS